MIDRQKLETLLSRRFPGATPQQIAAAANAIVALEKDGEIMRGRRKSRRRVRGSSPTQESLVAPIVRVVQA